MKEKICRTCEKEFKVYISQIKRNYGKFCSQKCRRPYKAEKRNCLFCNKKFWASPSEDRKTKDKRRFCSQECWYSFNRGANHPLFRSGKRFKNKDWFLWRKAIFERDGYRCKRCGSILKIEAHHIIPFFNKETRWKVGNGITLCKKCHSLTFNKEELWAENLFLMIEQGAM